MKLGKQLSMTIMSNSSRNGNFNIKNGWLRTIWTIKMSNFTSKNLDLFLSIRHNLSRNLDLTSKRSQDKRHKKSSEMLYWNRWEPNLSRGKRDARKRKTRNRRRRARIRRANRKRSNRSNRRKRKKKRRKRKRRKKAKEIRQTNDQS